MRGAAGVMERQVEGCATKEHGTHNREIEP